MAPIAANFPGPDVLGRGVVVAADAAIPHGFAGVRRLRIDDEVLLHPQAAAAVLYHHWLTRERIVIELAVTNDQVREPEVITLQPYQLGPDAGLHRERLHALMWANTYDLRGDRPVWWHGEIAIRHANAQRLNGQTDGSLAGDLRLPDGTPAWIDGGPRGIVDLKPADQAPIVHRESVALRRLTVPEREVPDVHDLATDQLAAVGHPAGPARVIAPAGSGKTRVLTARLRHLVLDRRIEPELITAVAYNTRAAEEMVARTADLNVSIRTLHSLALWICNLDARRQVIQEREVRSLLDRLVPTARIPNQDPHQPYLEALAETRLALRDPAEVEARRGDVDGFAEMFPAFREQLDDRGVLDFDEQIYRAIELLLTRPELRQRAQRACTHLLVDEFQDLTPAFLLLIRLVAGPTGQVFAVGDDDQTIYSYAGASPQYLVNFDRWFPGASRHALEVNYRCPPSVIGQIDRLLSHNRTRVPKVIRGKSRSEENTDTPITIHRVPATQMARTALDHMRELLADSPATELVVLARTLSALLPIQVTLTEAGVGHNAVVDTTVLRRTGVRTALAYLRLGADLERIRREDLFDTINRPARKVRSAVTPLLPKGQRWSIGQLEQVREALEGTHHDRFADYLADLRSLEIAITDGADTAACLRIIRDRIGLGEAMDALDRSRTRPEGSSHSDDLDALAQLAPFHPDPVTFQAWLTERLAAPAAKDGVTLSTVHRVKGMEWDHVVVFAVNAGQFPHRLAEDIEEERRVLHVAATRCRRSVSFVVDRDRPSPYLEELLQHRQAPEGGIQRSGEVAGTAAKREPDGTVVARLGNELTLVGGMAARVVERDDDAAALQLIDADGQPSTMPPVWLSDGSSVQVEGTTSTLRVHPPRQIGTTTIDDVDTPPVDESLFEDLRSWRARVASQTGAPAYLVFHDRHLRMIAGRRPRTLNELADYPGVGPTKLERYGDDILDIVERHA